jgi:hypothetical protein
MVGAVLGWYRAFNPTLAAQPDLEGPARSTLGPPTEMVGQGDRAPSAVLKPRPSDRPRRCQLTTLRLDAEAAERSDVTLTERGPLHWRSRNGALQASLGLLEALVGFEQGGDGFCPPSPARPGRSWLLSSPRRVSYMKPMSGPQ